MSDSPEIGTIILPPSKPSDLFWHADPAILATINQELSCDAYDRELLERVQQAYPEAEPQIARDATQYAAYAVVYYDDGTTDLTQECLVLETKTEEHIRLLAEELFNDSNVWLVEV